MKNCYECVVLGGGVAGAAGAFHLARLGYEVAVLEKTQGPHHKVCGEFLSGEARMRIQEMGIHLDDPLEVKHFRLFSPKLNINFEFPLPGWGITRYEFDEQLLDHAAKSGARVIRGVCVTGYDGATTGLSTIQTNKGDFHARHVFIATGKHDCSNASRRVGKDQAYMGLKTHIHSSSLFQKFKDTTALFVFKGGYAGICPVKEGVLNFCFVIKKNVYKSLGGNFGDAVSHVGRLNPQLEAVLEDVRFTEPVYAIGFIPYGFVRDDDNGRGHVYIGDQRTVLPSLTGDGMATALEMTRNSIEEFHRRRKGTHKETKHHAWLKNQMRWALWAHEILKHPRLTELLLFVSQSNPLLIDLFFNKTRISKIGSQE